MQVLERCKKMMRKGQFTIPNLVGVAVLLFIFSVLSEPIISILSSASASSNPMLSAVLQSFPAVFILMIILAPVVLAEKKRRQRKQETVQTRRGGRR